MIRRRRIAVVFLALVLGVAMGSVLAFSTPPREPASLTVPAPSGPTPFSTPNRARTPVPTPIGPPAPAPPRPPADSLHIPDRHLESYGATRVSWTEVIDAGRPLPMITERCRNSWRTSGKDPRLDWESAVFLCLDRLRGLGYLPQGVAGSATAVGYRIGHDLAADRNLVLTSWYSGAREPGLIAPNRTGQSVTRLMIMDLDRLRYSTVELVRSDGQGRLRNLNSHGSGLVWAGQYLYSSSRSALWMYNADDIVKIDGRFVLPAVARWAVDGPGGLSSISLDRSTRPTQLTAINYSKQAGAYIQSFDLDADGLLVSRLPRHRPALILRNVFGENRRVVSSANSMIILGSSYQGVATSGPHTLANSSALRLPGRGPVDATVVWRDGAVVDRFQMPSGNIESIYIDHRRGTFLSLTEHGSQFLFALPLEELTG